MVHTIQIHKWKIKKLICRNSYYHKLMDQPCYTLLSSLRTNQNFLFFCSRCHHRKVSLILFPGNDWKLCVSFTTKVLFYWLIAHPSVSFALQNHDCIPLFSLSYKKSLSLYCIPKLLCFICQLIRASSLGIITLKQSCQSKWIPILHSIQFTMAS